MTVKTETVPSSALTLGMGEFELGDNGEDAKSAPINIVARSNKVLDHWYWGRIVHDLSGCRHKNRIPIDYCHDSREVIGYLNKFDKSDQAVKTSGALVPFSKENDRASEVVHKAKNGVPYEASIFFDEPQLERIREGEYVTVNGKKFEGPGIVVRKWILRGVAVCPYGYDSNTSSKFNKEDQVQVQFINEEEDQEMAQNNETANELNNDETQTEEVDETTVDTDTGADDAEVETSTVEDETDTDTSTEDSETEMSDGQRFLNAFGDKGGVWFAEGRTFEEAQNLFNKSLQEDNQKLNEEIKKLNSKISAYEGEEEITDFSSGPDKKAKQSELAKKNGQTKGEAALAGMFEERISK